MVFQARGPKERKLSARSGTEWRKERLSPSLHPYCPGRHQTIKSPEVWRDELTLAGDIP